MSRELRMLVFGLFAGLLVAALLWFAMGRRNPIPEAKSSTPTSEAAEDAKMTSMSDSVDATPQRVDLTEEEQKNVGIQTTVVQKRKLRSEIVAVGRVEQAETQLSVVSARVGGRIDKLYVDFTGQSVRRGQAIAEIYSPEVVATVEEFRLAKESRQSLANASSQAVSQADDLIAASRRRLELWGFGPSQIDELAVRDRSRILVTIFSPSSGIVTDRRVAEGQYVKEGDPLYMLTDLSSIWVIADLYEADISQVRVGQSVQIEAQSLPGQRLRGSVTFIEPLVNEQTRTMPVRIQVPNPGMRLRPGMFADVKIASSSRETLAVPRDAVLHTGTRDLVYVAQEDGGFEGREIKVGPVANDFYPVLSGLKEGERVVARGAFMIDAQSRIGGGMGGMFGGSKEFERGSPSASLDGGRPVVEFRTSPSPPKGASENTFYVRVLDAGKPIADAQVKVALVMPAMPSMNMPEMRSGYELSWNGTEYEGKGMITMAGPWTTSIQVARGGKIIATKRQRLDAK